MTPEFRYAHRMLVSFQRLRSDTEQFIKWLLRLATLDPEGCVIYEFNGVTLVATRDHTADEIRSYYEGKKHEELWSNPRRVASAVY